MAKNNNISIKEADEQVRRARKTLAMAEMCKRRNCYHNHLSGAKLILVGDSRLPDREKSKYSDSTVMCVGDNRDRDGGCGDIFESNLYTRKEVEQLFFSLHSMMCQIQLITGANFDEQERLEFEEIWECKDKLEGFLSVFYNEMGDAMVKDTGGHKGGKKKTSKGGFGVTSGMLR